MENEKKRFVEQELNSDDYKKAVNGAKAVKEGGLIGSLVVGTFSSYGSMGRNSSKLCPT